MVKSGEVTPARLADNILSLFEFFKRVPLPMVDFLYGNLPEHESTLAIYRGLCFVHILEADAFLESVRVGGFLQLASFTTDPFVASGFADPDRVTASTLALQLQHHGYAHRRGQYPMVCILDGYH